MQKEMNELKQRLKEKDNEIDTLRKEAEAHRPVATEPTHEMVRNEVVEKEDGNENRDNQSIEKVHRKKEKIRALKHEVNQLRKEGEEVREKHLASTDEIRHLKEQLAEQEKQLEVLKAEKLSMQLALDDNIAQSEKEIAKHREAQRQLSQELEAAKSSHENEQKTTREAEERERQWRVVQADWQNRERQLNDDLNMAQEELTVSRRKHQESEMVLNEAKTSLEVPS